MLELLTAVRESNNQLDLITINLWLIYNNDVN